MRKINTQSFARATRDTPREINRRIILNLVREFQPISRAEIARRMGIGRGMVTTLVDELLSTRQVYAGDVLDAPRGRKPRMILLRTSDRLVVAIDVRFSRTFMMLADFSGRPIATDSFETVTEPVDLIAELSKRTLGLLAADREAGVCEGVGLVVPGMVDRETGTVLNSPQLGWKNVEIKPALERSTGLSVQIENAPIACALAHLWVSTANAEYRQNFVYLTVSDGVGSGIVVNGEVVRGQNSIAGEFGHVRMDPHGPECMCGARGCLECYCSNLATIIRYLGMEFSPRTARQVMHSVHLTVEEIIERARAGDARANNALLETARYLGEGIATVVNVLNPAHVFIGGEIAEAWDLVVPAIRRALAERALTPAAAETVISPDPSHNFPRLRGATALVSAQAFAAPEAGPQR